MKPKMEQPTTNQNWVSASKTCRRAILYLWLDKISLSFCEWNLLIIIIGMSQGRLTTCTCARGHLLHIHVESTPSQHESTNIKLTPSLTKQGLKNLKWLLSMHNPDTMKQTNPVPQIASHWIMSWLPPTNHLFGQTSPKLCATCRLCLCATAPCLVPVWSEGNLRQLRQSFSSGTADLSGDKRWMASMTISYLRKVLSKIRVTIYKRVLKGHLFHFHDYWRKGSGELGGSVDQAFKSDMAFSMATTPWKLAQTCLCTSLCQQLDFKWWKFGRLILGCLLTFLPQSSDCPGPSKPSHPVLQCHDQDPKHPAQRLCAHGCWFNWPNSEHQDTNRDVTLEGIKAIR